MSIKKYTAPSAWASYLINGDATGISDTDKEAADQWISDLGYGSPLCCEDAGFRNHHDAFNVMSVGADCQEYTFKSHYDSGCDYGSSDGQGPYI